MRKFDLNWYLVSEPPKENGWYLTSFMGCIPRVTYYSILRKYFSVENGVAYPTHWCYQCWNEPPRD